MPFGFLCCVKPGVEDVTELDYSHQSLSDVPNEVFAHERTLETLLCQSNRITELPRQLFMCHGLKNLDLSDNELLAIPIAISSLVNLQKLNLSRNTLTSIPETMKALKHLRFLDLSINPLEKLPEVVTNLIGLQELFLNDSYLEYLPGNFGRLANLRLLELRDNYLMILPKSLSRASDLSRIDLGQNELQEFPEVIGRFSKLKELWIDCNTITVLPADIKGLESLVHLEASNNMIEDIAPEIGFCVQLVDINLTSNNLTQLPEAIGHLKNLTTLKLDNNRLYCLPESIGSLDCLEELTVMCNYIDVLPHTIGLLRKLKYLNLDENLLSSLPSEIGSCIMLSVLSVRSNKLINIPPEIGHLSQLKVLNLVRNSLKSLPQALLNCENLVALWLSENQSKPLVPMHSEVDPHTYEPVLTCFLFPQVPLPSMESKNNNDKNDNTDNHPPSRHISFVDMKAVQKLPEKPGQLRRAPTPYPKELRALAKHARNIQKDGNQDVTPPVPSAVHIKAAKITPTLQQKYASDNNKDNFIDDANKDVMPLNYKKMSIYDNLPENTYDRPLELNHEHDKTYKSVDHALYSENNDMKDQYDDLKNMPLNQIVDAEKQSSYGRSSNFSNYSHNNDNFKLNDVHNQIQRMSVSTHADPKLNTSTNYKPTAAEDRTHLEPLPLRQNHGLPLHINDGNYHEGIYEGETYKEAKAKLYAQNNCDLYGYTKRSVVGSRIPTVSNIVSKSDSAALDQSNIYSTSNNEPHHYGTSVHKSSPNSNSYRLEPPSPTYIPTQCPELYSPTGHTNLTNPYRMTNTPLVCDDGRYGHVHTPSQNIYDLYDSIPPSAISPNPSNQQNTSASTPEPIYGRHPPPYHIAAQYTKHAQFFNGSNG